VIDHQAVEQRVIHVLQSAQEDVALDIHVSILVRRMDALHPGLNYFDRRREQDVHTEEATVVLGNAAALVEDGFIDQLETAQGDFSGRRAHGCCS
jgi:hypothetical protein